MLNRIAAEPPISLASGAERPSARGATVAGGAQPFAARIERGSRSFTEALASWQRLAREAPPMLSPEFFLLTARRRDLREATLFGARRGQEIVAALPLARDGRTLVAVLSDHTPRFDLVGDRAALPQLWRAVRDAGGWDVLDLERVPCDSPVALELAGLARADGHAVTVLETHKVPRFLVHGIEQRIHRRFRGDMRRLERQLGGVELERVGVFDRGALRELWRLEAAAWKGAAGTAIACDPSLVRFYTALARVFARRGRLTIAFLRAQGRRIAGCFALEDATTFYLLKIGHDPAYAHYGPGHLLVRETAADAARRGLQRYDLLGRSMPWKAKWSDEAVGHVGIRIYAPSARGRALHFAREIARPLAGRALRRALRGVRGRVPT
jgi:CelD/BcsL family acetyltransferase involved in cellulose biosynthesis